jgi:pimeloyl-ACP methyl ester carboxylesterase
MRLAARRQAGWAISSLLLEGSTRQVSVGGDLVDVIRVGSGDPIVIVPGMAGGWRLVAPLAEQLARRFEVILCGLRGDRFPSSGPWVREVGDHASDVASIITQLGLERPTVLGVSFGGAVALELAADHPRMVGGLIIHGAATRFPVTIGSTVARRVLERFPLPKDNRFVNQFFNLLHGGKPEPGPLAEFVIERIWETDQCVMARRLGLLEQFDVSDRLWRIDAPTLVLAGERDVIVPPERQRALADQIPGARFALIEGAGHLGFLSHRGEIAGHATNLVRQVNHSVC